MTDPTPRDMLQFYRRKSHAFDNEQAEQFNAMPLKDRLELLFYMLLNTNKVVQMLHERVAPGEVETQPMPEPERGH